MYHVHHVDKTLCPVKMTMDAFPKMPGTICEMQLQEEVCLEFYILHFSLSFCQNLKKKTCSFKMGVLVNSAQNVYSTCVMNICLHCSMAVLQWSTNPNPLSYINTFKNWNLRKLCQNLGIHYIICKAQTDKFNKLHCIIRWKKCYTITTWDYKKKCNKHYMRLINNIQCSFWVGGYPRKYVYKKVMWISQKIGHF